MHPYERVSCPNDAGGLGGATGQGFVDRFLRRQQSVLAQHIDDRRIATLWPRHLGSRHRRELNPVVAGIRLLVRVLADPDLKRYLDVERRALPESGPMAAERVDGAEPRYTEFTINHYAHNGNRSREYIKPSSGATSCQTSWRCSAVEAISKFDTPDAEPAFHFIERCMVCWALRAWSFTWGHTRSRFPSYHRPSSSHST